MNTPKFITYISNVTPAYKLLITVGFVELKEFLIYPNTEDLEKLKIAQSVLKGELNKKGKPTTVLTQIKQTVDNTQQLKEQDSTIKTLQETIARLRGEKISDLDLQKLIELQETLYNAVDKVTKQIELCLERKGNENLCMMCFKQKKDIVFLRCKHLCVCEKCSQKVTICPICKKTVEQRVKVYDS